MFKIQTSCPTRIDLAGGTLDLWPLYHQLEEKATVNLAINLCAQIELKKSPSSLFIFESLDQGYRLEGSFDELTSSKKLPLFSLFLKALWKKELPPLEITAKAKSPKGAGLGGSSSLSIALVAAFLKARELCDGSKLSSEEKLVSIARDVESKIIKSPTGYQDYWAAVRGGLNLITYPYGQPKIETMTQENLDFLSEKLIVVYSGQSRDSSLNNWSVYKSFFSGESKTIKALEEIGTVSLKCMNSFKQGQIKKALEFSKEEWELRKNLWPDIVTEKTEFIDNIARESGASFSRICGAGGGGVMSIFIEADQKKALRDSLSKNGIQILEAGITKNGLAVSCT